MNRRLTTILVADIVSYSSLMEADEEGTARRLNVCRAMAEREIASADGRVFKAMGDALLAEFKSPINAVRAAVEMRGGLALAEREEVNPLSMRFGLHLADVLVDGDDLIGDGVNLAARIQQAADPSAIDLSATLFEQIRRTSPYAFDDRGLQTFRHMSEPVRIYRLRGEIERHVYQLAPTRSPPSRPRRPCSLAVLPIEVLSGDDDQRFLAEGIAEEFILELSRFHKLFVSSRSATRSLEGSHLNPTAVGDKLGVRYVLSGTLRRLGSQLRLGLALIETEQGIVVWSDRLARPLDDLVAGFDDLVARVVSTVLGRIEEHDIAATRRCKPESMTAFECHLRGLEYHRLGGVTDANLKQALDWFERAIVADQNFARPRAMWVCARSNLPDFDWDDGESRTQRALELDPNDPEANRIMGSILLHRGSFDAARQYHEKALALSPCDAYIKARSAAFYNFVGEPERALELLDEAAELDPFLPVWCVEERAATLYSAGEYAEAIEAGRGLSFQTRRSRLYRAASRLALNEHWRARQLVAEALAAAPDLSTDFVQQNELYRDPDVTGLLIDRLASAGLPTMAPIARAF